MRIFKTEQEYRKYPAISQSALGYLDQHPKYYRHKIIYKGDEKNKDFFRIGSAVDALLTDPDTFHDHYSRASGFMPTEKMAILCNSFFRYHYKSKLSYEDAFTMAYQDSKYSTSSKVIKERFEAKHIQSYIEELRNSEGKVLLPEAEFKMIREVGKAVRDSKHTREYFNSKFHKEGVEYLYQFPILFKCGGKECKGLLDLLVIDHNNKTIQIVDLKTTGKSNQSFAKSFVQFRYYLQAAFYTEGLKQFIKTSKLKLGVDLTDYRIINFSFVVAETNCYNLPIIYTCSDNDLYVGEHGGKHMEYKRNFKGFRQLLEELSWHEENNYWEMPFDLHRDNMTVPLDIFIHETE